MARRRRWDRSSSRVPLWDVFVFGWLSSSERSAANDLRIVARDRADELASPRNFAQTITCLIYSAAPHLSASSVSLSWRTHARGSTPQFRRLEPLSPKSPDGGSRAIVMVKKIPNHGHPDGSAHEKRRSMFVTRRHHLLGDVCKAEGWAGPARGATRGGRMGHN